MRTMSACEGFFAKLSPYPYVKLLFGGLILSSLIFLFPSLYGEGYTAVNVLLKGQNVEDWGQVMSRSLFYGHNQLLILYIALVTFTKVLPPRPPMVVADAVVPLLLRSLSEVLPVSSLRAFGM